MKFFRILNWKLRCFKFSVNRSCQSGLDFFQYRIFFCTSFRSCREVFVFHLFRQGRRDDKLQSSMWHRAVQMILFESSTCVICTALELVMRLFRTCDDASSYWKSMIDWRREIARQAFDRLLQGSRLQSACCIWNWEINARVLEITSAKFVNTLL